MINFLNMTFKVKEVIDGDTFTVNPGWKWEEQSGDIIRPIGFNTPEKGKAGYAEAKRKLSNLLLNKEVELKNPVKLTYGRLLCDVYIGGKNLKNHFPEYQ